MRGRFKTIFVGLIIIAMIMSVVPLSASASAPNVGIILNPKIDPYLHMMLGDEEPSRLSLLSADGGMVSVLLKTNGDPTAKAKLEANGVKVRSVIGDIMTASIPKASISTVADMPEVVYIEGDKPVSLEMDRSVPEIRADDVQDVLYTPSGGTTSSVTGKGVVVGIIDSGIDFMHPDFRKDDDSTRILRLWDQTLVPGCVDPKDLGSTPSDYGYGLEYTSDDINIAIPQPEPHDYVAQKDFSGHGTRVAGIAAGGGRGWSLYTGVAPEAEIVYVKAATPHGTPDEYDTTETHVIEGMDYIYNYAQSFTPPKPLVISMSLGTNWGPHDGTSLWEQEIDTLSGLGVVIVNSAGNEGNKDTHMSGDVTAGGTVTKTFHLAPAIHGLFYHNIWYKGSDRMSITLVAPDGTTFGLNPPASGTVSASSTHSSGTFSGVITLYSTVNHQLNGDNYILVETDGWVGDEQDWEIRLTGITIADGHFDSWITRYQGWMYYNEPDPSSTISTPGTANEVIAVGSYNTRPVPGGALSSFSSLGPTRDGRPQPVITAPGNYIIGPVSGDSGLVVEYSEYTNYDNYLNNRKAAGTSFSAPHVAGAVALMLQVDSTLDHTTIKTRLQQTAKTDTYTGTVPNDEWGYGKIDALALSGLPDITPVKRYTNTRNIGLTISPDGGGWEPWIEMRFTNEDTYGWKWYTVDTIPSIESSHPVYTTEYVYLIEGGASGLKIHFENIVTEITDYVYVKDSSGNIISSFSGDYPSGAWSDIVPGSHATIEVVVDPLNTEGSWGFSIDQYKHYSEIWSLWDIYSTTKAWTISESDGNKKVYVQVRDANGDLAETADWVVLDTIPPTTTHSTSVNPGTENWFNSDVTITLEANDESPIVAIEYAINDEDCFPYPNPFIKTTEGVYPVEYYSEDAAGNIEDPRKTYSFGIDKTNPTVPGTPSPQGTFDGTTLWSDASVTWTWPAASDPLSGIWGYLVTVRENSVNGPIVVTDAWTDTNSYTFTSLAEVTYFAEVKAVDKAGNIGDYIVSTQGIRVDATSSINSEIVTDEVRSLMPTLELYSEDVLSGVAEMRLANKGDVWWEEVESIESPHGSNGENHWFKIYQPGASKLKLHFSEINLVESGAGPASAGDGDTIMVEPPEYISDYLEVYDGAKSTIYLQRIGGPYYDIWTAEIPGDSAWIHYATPDGTEDATVGSWGFLMDKYQWFDELDWSEWVQYSTTYSWQLEPDPDGLYKVYYQTRDLVENEALPVSKFINYLGPDTIPPTTSLTINDGAQYITSYNVYPPPVKIDIFGMDNVGGSGVKDLRLSFGTVWSDWYDWPIVGPGEGQPQFQNDVDPATLTTEELEIWNYFVDGCYPTVGYGWIPIPENGFEPSRSLIDAMLEDGVLSAGDDRELFVVDQTGGIHEGNYVEYWIGVTDSSLPLRITLAWQDDYTPVLDDLDLEVIAPGGAQYRDDGIDRIEQVVFDTPSSGVYRVRVYGESLSLSDVEPFAVVLTGNIDDGYGVVLLDRTKYDDSDVMNLRVEDINSIGTTVLLTITTSSGDSESINIPRTAVNSGIYLGSINLVYGTTPAPDNDILEVVDGEEITVTYSDGAPSHDYGAKTTVDISLAQPSVVTLDDFQLSKGWGMKFVYVQIRDKAGHIAQAYDTIKFLDAHLPTPYTEVLVYQEVNITLEMTGRKWNTVGLMVLEDGKPIDGMSLTRVPGDPTEQSKTFTLKVYTSVITIDGNTTSRTREYQILLRYYGRHYGANPFELIFESNGNQEIVSGEFVYNKKFVRYSIEYVPESGEGFYLGDSTSGNTIDALFDINEVLANALEGNGEFHFNTVGMSICHWDFGDGTEAFGEVVEHTYAEAGTYTVTLTYRDSNGDIIETVQFEVIVT